MADAYINNRSNIEVKYARKPSDATRAALVAAGFHWHQQSETWWSPVTPDAVDLAVKIDANFKRNLAPKPKAKKVAAAPAKKRATKGNPAQVAVGVKLSHDGKGGFRVGDGSAGYTVMKFASEKEAVAFARRHPGSLMPNQIAAVRAVMRA